MRVPNTVRKGYSVFTSKPVNLQKSEK